jgi:YD repeat-containing protein
VGSTIRLDIYTPILREGQYTISSPGALQLIRDIGGNIVNVTSAVITSSTWLSVSFVRDSAGRLTKITDPQGDNYLYSYDFSGNLASVTYPGITQPSTYTYAANHLYLNNTDFRGNPLSTAQYYANDNSYQHRQGLHALTARSASII